MENLNTSSCLTNGETKEQRNKRLAYDFYRYIGNADYEKAKAMCDPNEFIFHPMIYINADLDGFIDLEAMHMDPMPGLLSPSVISSQKETGSQFTGSMTAYLMATAIWACLALKTPAKFTTS